MENLELVELEDYSHYRFIYSKNDFLKYSINLTLKTFKKVNIYLLSYNQE